MMSEAVNQVKESISCGVIEVQNLRDIKKVGFRQEIIEAAFIFVDGQDFEDEGFAKVVLFVDLESWAHLPHIVFTDFKLS